MTLQRRLQIGMALLTTLGTTLLGLGQHRLALPVLAALAGIGSLVLTDIKGWLRLNATVANLAALAAIAVAAAQWEHITDEGALLALANLLFYLQCVLLFKPKTVHSYWLLATSSLMQVAVACALSMEMSFGLLLLAYAVVGIGTMCLFYLYREQQGRVEGPRGAGETAASGSRRWPLAAVRPAVVAAAGGEFPPAALGREFHRRLAGLLGATLFVATGLFLVIPRGTRSAWRPPLPGAQHLVGFAPQVTLGELGTIVENSSLVMRLRLVSIETGQTYRLVDPPLLRGSILSRYDNGQWERARAGRGLPGPAPPLPAATRDLVRQEIAVEPLATDVLFAVYPGLLASDQKKALYYPEAEQLVRTRSSSGQRLTYQVLTAALANHRQDTITPAPRELTAADREQLLRLPVGPDGSDPLAGLKAAARQVVAAIAPGDALARAHALERHLRDSGQFAYTLNPPARDAALDPLEDFITRHPQGHCEYFASALVLMLRSVGIPARLAVGFRGGEFNPVTERYEVQQLHAHAWAEAWLAPDELGEEDLPSTVWGPAAGRRGAWLRLDPTPSGEVVRPLDESVFWFAWYSLRDVCRALWSEFVLDMDAARQRTAIYDPAAQAVTDLWTKAGTRDYWRWAREGVGRLADPAAWRGGGLRLTASDMLQGTLAALAALAGVYVLARILPEVRRRWRRAPPRRRAAAAPPRFYLRFEALLRRRRLRRPPGQTPREFALAVGGHLAESRAAFAEAALPRHIVEAYYRVRFGRRPLDKREAEAVEQALAQLEAALRR